MAPYDTRSTDYGNLCTTPACIHLASEILWALAPNYTEIDPCTDFDKLVCGSWAAHNEIPAGSDYINALTETGDRTMNTVRQMLEGSYPTGSDAGWITVDLTKKQVKADKDNFAKIQKAYDVCMDHETLEEQGLAPLAGFVKSVVELFPASGDSEEGDYSDALGKTITLFESLGIETIQRMVQTQNTFNPEEILLYIIPPSNSDIPSTEEEITEYLELSATLLSAVHPGNLSIKEATRRMKSAIRAQLSLQELISETSDDEDTATGLEAISELAPQLNYEYVIGKLAPEEFDTTTTVLQGASYFGNLSQSIADVPRDVIQTFFVWKAIAAVSPYVESDETNTYNAFMTKQRGDDPESPAPRWKQCVGLLDDGVDWIKNDEVASGTIGPSGLTWILAHFFLDKNYSEEAKELTSDIVDALEAAFLSRLEAKNWVTDKVKAAATEKVKKMKSQISWPTDPDTLDPIALKAYYKEAVVTSSHVKNALGFAYANVAHSWETLGKPLGRGKFAISTLTPNAYQASQLNTMVLAAGIQQFPIYDVDFPAYIIYGGMGSIVGHELTHGFDNNGRQFDATGNMTTWWDEETIAEFTNRTECFIEQYSRFTIAAPNGTRLPVDGENTLGENIADAGGVVSSFDAWKKWEKAKGKAKDLPGLSSFTHEQLFFLKWGQSWCQNMPAEQQVAKLSDEHSPNDARIKLTLDNSAGFREAFKCKKKEPTCELW